MKILITGMGGFIGTHLAERLRKRHEVIGLDVYMPDKEAEINGIPVRFADIRDAYSLRETFDEIRPEIVIHLAAQTPVAYSFGHENEVMDVNMDGTMNIAREASRLRDLKKFIFASSVEVYGNQAHIPISENQQVRPASPYGVAKASAEFYVNYLFGKTGFKFPCIMLRCTNTYGRKGCHTFVIEQIINDILAGKETIPLGEGEPIRDFLYVDDEIDVYEGLVESSNPLLFGNTYNTGTGFGITIYGLFEKIKKMMGSNAHAHWGAKGKRPYEIWNLTMDANRLHDAIGWSPKHTLEDGLRKTIDWWTAWKT